MLGLRRKKRGQTLYIVIGVVALILLLVGTYLYSSKAKAKTTEEEIKSLEESVLPKLKAYMEQVMNQASIDSIIEIGERGGTFVPNPSTFGGGPIEMLYTCYTNNPSDPLACVNTFLTRKDIEEELAARILTNLESSIDLIDFENQGIVIGEGSKSVNVILGKTTVLVELNFPLNLTVDNKVEKIDTFQSIVNLPLGLLYDISKYITNTEIQEMEFNIDEWNQKHPDLFVNIQMNQVGDDKIFTLLMDDYFFNFAVVDTELNPSENGCCYDMYDMSCFKNVPETECDITNGFIYDNNEECYCPTEGDLSCVVSLYDAGCTAPYEEVLRLSGYENAHASLPPPIGNNNFKYSLCCNIFVIWAISIQQDTDVIGTDCSDGAVFAKLSSNENAHVSDPGYTFFNQNACISSVEKPITCMARTSGICLGNEEPVISLMDDTNAHVGHPYRYDKKICCEAEDTT